MEEGRDSQRRDRKVDEDSSDRKIRRMLLRRARREEQRKKQNQDCNRGCFNAGQAGKPAADSRATGMNHGYSGGIKLWVNISEQTVFAVKRM